MAIRSSPTVLRVLVVYPVPNPDTCNLCAGLRARGHDVEFLTSFALAADRARRIPAQRWFARFGFPIERRVYPELNGVRLKLRPDLVLRANLGRRWGDRSGVLRPDAYELFDRAGARRVVRGNYDVVVSAIGASRRTFAAAKAAGVTRVLNLPIVPLACLQPELEAERAISPERARCFGLALDDERFAREEAEFAGADGVLAPSEFVEQSVRKRFRVGAPIFSIPFGATLQVSVPELRLARGPLRVLFAGQLVQRKGIFDLLEAVQRLMPQTVELWVVGPAPFGTDALGAGFARARYKGTLSRRELARLMGMCDVLCLPTLAEGFPLVVLEAMATGLPVIATDVCRGVVRHEENGVLVERRAPEQIAAAIERLHSDRALLQKLAAGAWETARRFTWADYQRDTAGAIEEIAARGARPATPVNRRGSRPRCVLVAPFDPAEQNDATGLGATRKIAGVIRMFIEQGWQVIVVDSSHSHVGSRPSLARRLRIEDSRSVVLISPATYARRSVGKLLQLFAAPSFARRLARRPYDLLWIYNGYAFEVSFARAFLRQCHAPLVVELEDWPFARSRGWRSVKNLIDWIGLRWSMRRAVIVTCVNDALAARLGLGVKALSFPGLVEFSGRENREPFADNLIRLGYFGGLDSEKGADVLLKVIPGLRDGWKLVVTGDGPLAEQFHRAAVKHADKLEFHGIVPTETLRRLQRDCDAFLNPHQSIAAMGEGVFPFKIFEYLSHGRPLISTELPAVTPDISAAIIWVEPTVHSIEAAISKLPNFWKENRKSITEVRRKINANFTREAFFALFIARLSAVIAK